MNSLQILIFTLIDVYGFILVLRAWFQFSRVDFYNPLSQGLVKITQPVLSPLRTFIPTFRNIDLAALILAFLLFSIKFPLAHLVGNVFISHADILDYALAGLLTLIRTCGKAVFYVLLLSAIMSWFNRSPNPMQFVLHQLTSPLLSPIQRILPNTGMIDFSPMILVFGLFFLDKVLLDLFGAYWLLASY
ncbi:YggT family protein [Pasteurella canis]|uniref:YggT family protein n=1 Tax=Pasteurella canis TaxID=753 RepID=UPI001D101E2F|nr:YggT family protein [Pasteurella canis]UDW83617.1 YggT family protein [Pasteurella canis]